MENRNTSKRIKMNKLNNLRDLGGIRTTDDHVIKENRLYRSGQLFFADPEDIKKLKSLGISKIFDLRSGDERIEKPDPQIADEVNIHLPIIREVFAGITRDEKSEEKAFEMMIQAVKKDPSYGIRYMEDTYLNMVNDEYSVSQYAAFVKAVADNENGAILWHCTAGKDRAGFATVLLLEILGVSRQDILEDYLETNGYLYEEMESIIRMLRKKMELGGAEDVIMNFFGARAEYLDMIYKYVEENYGGMAGFIRDAMGISDEEKEKIREKYLL